MNSSDALPQAPHRVRAHQVSAATWFERVEPVLAILIAVMLFGLGSCTTAKPMASDDSMLAKVSGSGSIHLSADAEQLIGEIVLTNTAPEPVRFMVLSYCPFTFRVLDSASGEVVFSTESRGCPRAGREIEINPGGVQALSETLRVQELRDSGVSPGDYRFVGVLRIGERLLEVELGNSVIPV